MKACPKCNYENNDLTSILIECPSCGIIYEKALNAINEEKIRKNESKYDANTNKIKYFISDWTWDEMKSKKG